MRCWHIIHFYQKSNPRSFIRPGILSDLFYKLQLISYCSAITTESSPSVFQYSSFTKVQYKLLFK